MNRIRFILAALLVFAAAAFFLTATVYTDWLWFKSLGYDRLFVRSWAYRIGVGAAFGFFAFFFLAINVYLARKLSPNTRFISHNVQLEQFISQTRRYFDQYFTLAAYTGSAVVGVIAGISMASAWESWLQYFFSLPTGTKDPLFGRDISFYFFTLPVVENVLGFLFLLTLVALGLAVFFHLVRGPFNLPQGLRAVYPRGAAHIAVLAGLLMVVISANWWVAAQNLVYSPRGAVFGAGYTDVTVLLPAYRYLLYIGLATALLVVVGGVTRRWFLPIAGLAVLGLTLVIGTAVLPTIVQQYRVSPNEIAKEKPFIARNIKATRKAFGIDKVARKVFPVKNDLTRKTLARNQETIDSMRLWDWRPLKTTYSQIQEIRLYYKFNDVDLDRYVIDGEYRQIALSAREMDVAQLPETARTWVNQHIVYTHGYGVVASPVNEVAGEGLPKLIIKNIPPKSTTDLKVKRPEIYYGESTNNYVLINTKTSEFDFPAGEKNKYAEYNGTGGIVLSNYLTKLAFAYRFGTIKLAVSEALKPQSRILFNRTIKSRLGALTPFVAYDSDPYLVINDGRLFWMIDGYTVSDRYPYSNPTSGGFNYIRNSVKVVVDAYNGSVDFYVADKDDPIIKAYSRAYPGTFKNLDEMDEGLLEHLRYPETLFRTQADVFTSFHMTDPQVFYNKEDLWDTPQEIYQAETQPMDPYYVMMQLPGEKETEFVMILPFTPTNKNNMIAWLAARSDAPHYGELILQTFPKDKLIYGPLQIEARLDQNPEISRQLSLWDQRGSQIIRGNLLVVPVGNSILFVEPIYLQAESGELPELIRVAAGLGEKVVMEESLEEALTALLGEDDAPDDETGDTTVDDEAGDIDPDDDESNTTEDVVKRAAKALKRAEQAQQEGDWTEYGRQLSILKNLLNS